MQPAPDLALIQSSLRSLDVGLRWLMTFVLLALAGYATRIMMTLPFQEKIYEDMLGSLEKLPLLSKLLLDLHPGGMLAAWLACAVSMLLLWISRRPSTALFLSGLGALFLVLLIAIHGLCIEVPMLQIIQGINTLN